MGRIYEYDADAKRLFTVVPNTSEKEARGRIVDCVNHDRDSTFLFIEDNGEVALWAYAELDPPAPDEPNIVLRYLSGEAMVEDVKQMGDDALYDTIVDSEYYSFWIEH